MLRQALLKIEPIEENELNHIVAFFEWEAYSKKTTLCYMNQVANQIYFVCQGMLRLYTEKEDSEELTIFLFPEGLFAASFESFITQQKSQQVIETLEDSYCLCLSYANLQALYQRYPVFNSITRKIAELRFINAQRIFTSYIMDSPEQRYNRLMKEQPGLIQRVPLHILASFLGITPVSLSRIRKRIQAGPEG